MTNSTTSVNLPPTGIGSDYGSSGYVRIGSEVMALHDQAIHSRLHAHKRTQQQVRINRRHSAVVLSGSWSNSAEYRL